MEKEKEKATRISDKQRKESFYDSKLKDVLDSESLDAFWEKSKKDGLDTDIALNGLVSLYVSGSIKLKKQKITKEIIVLDL